MAAALASYIPVLVYHGVFYDIEELFGGYIPAQRTLAVMQPHVVSLFLEVLQRLYRVALVYEVAARIEYQ